MRSTRILRHMTHFKKESYVQRTELDGLMILFAENGEKSRNEFDAPYVDCYEAFLNRRIVNALEEIYEGNLHAFSAKLNFINNFAPLFIIPKIKRIYISCMVFMG